MGRVSRLQAFSVEALCYLDGNCSSAFEIMSTFADNTYEGPFGQAHEVPQKSIPPYTPFNDAPAFKPIAGVTRYIAIEGGSFVDAVIRGFFGYHPTLQWPGSGVAPQVALTAALDNPTAPRGFAGSLKNLRTPYGILDSGLPAVCLVWPTSMYFSAPCLRRPHAVRRILLGAYLQCMTVGACPF